LPPKRRPGEGAAAMWEWIRAKRLQFREWLYWRTTRRPGRRVRRPRAALRRPLRSRRT